ncbi:hypothetical protein V6N13_074752 [Hibiscus sabdariffa]
MATLLNPSSLLLPPKAKPLLPTRLQLGLNSLTRRLPSTPAPLPRIVKAAALDSDYSPKRSSSNEPRETIMLPGCDYNHWLIVMEFPKDPAPTREQMIETYLNTLATVLGSMEEAKKNMYAFSTTTYTGFQCTVSEETSEKFKGLPGVLWVLPDSYIDVKNKDYGGDKYINGEIIPCKYPTYQPKPRKDSKYTKAISKSIGIIILTRVDRCFAARTSGTLRKLILLFGMLSESLFWGKAIVPLSVLSLAWNLGDSATTIVSGFEKRTKRSTCLPGMRPTLSAAINSVGFGGVENVRVGYRKRIVGGFIVFFS